jgi:hypothetical protein
MFPQLEISNDPAIRQQFADLLQTAAPDTQAHFRTLLKARGLSIPGVPPPGTSLPLPPPAVPQLGWQTTAKIPSPTTSAAVPPAALPNTHPAAAESVAKAEHDITLAQRMDAAGQATAAIPQVLHALDPAAALPPLEPLFHNLSNHPALQGPSAPADNNPTSAPALVAIPVAILRRLSLWEDGWSTTDPSPLVERLEQLTARAAELPIQSSQLDALTTCVAELSMRLSDYQLDKCAAPQNLNNHIQTADKRLEPHDEQLTTLGARAVEAQDNTHTARHSVSSTYEELVALQQHCDSQQDGLRKAFDICSNLLQRVDSTAARLGSGVDALDTDLAEVASATTTLLLNTEEGALTRAQATLAQVTELQGQVLSLVEPHNRLKLEGLWKRIQTFSDLAQKHDTQILEVVGNLRKLLPLIPLVWDHTQDLQALWVHLRDSVHAVDHGWHDAYGIPSTENLPPRHVHPVPLSLPTDVHSQSSSPDSVLDITDYFFAPTVQPLPVGTRIPTSAASPTHAAGGGQAHSSSNHSSSNTSLNLPVPVSQTHPHNPSTQQPPTDPSHLTTSTKQQPSPVVEEQPTRSQTVSPKDPSTEPVWCRVGNHEVDTNLKSHNNLSQGWWKPSPETSSQQTTTPAEAEQSTGAASSASPPSPKTNNPFLVSQPATPKSSTFSAFERGVECSLNQQRKGVLLPIEQDDPMDIAGMIASAKERYTPIQPARSQQPAEGAGPSGLIPEALLPGLPEEVAKLPKLLNKSKAMFTENAQHTAMKRHNRQALENPNKLIQPVTLIQPACAHP